MSHTNQLNCQFHPQGSSNAGPTRRIRPEHRGRQRPPGCGPFSGRDRAPSAVQSRPSVQRYRGGQVGRTGSV